MSIAAALCIAAGALTVALPARSFTLSWEHSVEKLLWEEDYLIAGDWLFLSAARIRGSGAGMEPPADAVRIDGQWVYRPADPWRRSLVLAASEYGGDHLLCIEDRCRRLAGLLGGARGPVTLAPCTAAGNH